MNEAETRGARADPALTVVDFRAIARNRRIVVRMTRQLGDAGRAQYTPPL